MGRIWGKGEDVREEFKVIQSFGLGSQKGGVVIDELGRVTRSLVLYMLSSRSLCQF